MGKIYCVGDIHGCYDQLMGLYGQLIKDGMRPGFDKLIFLGDYIDRGPKSPEVVQQLIDWKKKYPHWKFLMGNHEHMFKDALFDKAKTYGANCWEANGGRATLMQYDLKFDKSHIDFLCKELELYYESRKYIFVHGGLMPNHPPKVSYAFPKTMLWVREDFINSKYDWGKKVIFGHTPQPDFKPCIMTNKIGIDGGVHRLGGQLIGIKLPEEKLFFERN